MTTVSAIKNRLVAIYGDISGIVTALDTYPDNNLPFENAELPAVVVRLVPDATNERLGARSFKMTRTFQAILHLQTTSGDWLLPDNTAEESAEPFMVSVPLAFCNAPHLERSDVGLALSADVPDCNGPVLIEKDGGRYIGLVFTHVIQTIHRS